ERHRGPVPPEARRVLELGSRRGQHEQRAAHMGEDVLEEVEEGVVCPVHVLDQDHGGARRRGVGGQRGPSGPRTAARGRRGGSPRATSSPNASARISRSPSRSRTFSKGSPSPTPRCSLSRSPSGVNAVWPYGRQRPVRSHGCGSSAESHCHSSRTSRVLPTP